jgi:hypothetical protein
MASIRAFAITELLSTRGHRCSSLRENRQTGRRQRDDCRGGTPTCDRRVSADAPPGRQTRLLSRWAASCRPRRSITASAKGLVELKSSIRRSRIRDGTQNSDPISFAALLALDRHRRSPIRAHPESRRLQRAARRQEPIKCHSAGHSVGPAVQAVTNDCRKLAMHGPCWRDCSEK